MAETTAAVLSEVESVLRKIFHRLDVPSPVFRANLKILSLQKKLWRPCVAPTYTNCFSKCC